MKLVGSDVQSIRFQFADNEVARLFELSRSARTRAKLDLFANQRQRAFAVERRIGNGN